MRKNRALLLLPALLVLLSLALSGCKDFSFYGVLGDRIDDTPLTISPATVTVPMSGALTFTATGGKPPYSFARVSGTGSIDAGTGLYTAPPTAGSETVRVTDSKGRRSDATITVTTSGGMLAISPDAVSMGPGGRLTFVASGGTAPYTFSLTATGSGSPLINDGGISGAYVAGASIGTDTIQVQDSALPTATTATATVNVTSITNVDYIVTAVNNTGTLHAGGDLDGDYSVKNIGSVNGAQNIYWQAYASFNNNSLDAGDALVASGSLGPLNTGQEVTGVLFSGTWPGVTGPYYLIVMVGAMDDSNSGNNAGFSGLLTLLVPIVNYTVGNVNYTGPNPAAPSTAAPGTFDYSNIGTDDGSQWVGWTVYASPDTTLDAFDLAVASGSASPLDSGAAPSTIPFNGGWPLNYGNYYLFVRLSVPEDVDPGNNSDRTTTQAPVGVYNAIVQNGDCINLLNYTDLTGVVLKPGMSVKVVSAGFPSTHDDHLFRVNVGTASTFTASWVLDNTAATEDIGVYWYKPGPPGVILGGYWIGGIASITLTFPVHPVNDAGQNRWIDLYSDKNKNLGSYVLYITAN